MSAVPQDASQSAALEAHGVVWRLPAQRSWMYHAGQFLRRKPLGAAGAALLALLVLVAVFASQIAPYDPLIQDVPNQLRPPGAPYLLGTDNFGRDVLSRVVFGARISLYVGLLSVLLGNVVGVLLGVASGYRGGQFDLLLQRVTDALLGFPSIVLAMAMVVGLGGSLNAVTLAIAVALVPRMIRVSRSTALSVKEEQYVVAARAMGCGDLRIILLHVVPNCLAPVFVLATAYLGTAMVTEATLSFLGLGVPPPHPSWGGMMQFGAKGYMEAAPWLTIFPGIALSLAVFSFALLGDALRDVLDPRLRGA